MAEIKRLNVESDIRSGWVNLDSASSVRGIDVVHDLGVQALLFADNTFDAVLAQNVLVHVGD